MKKISLLVILSVAFIWMRVNFRDQVTIDHILGIINVIAALYIAADILWHYYKMKKEKYDKSTIPDETKKIRLRHILLTEYTILVSLLGIGSFYFIIWANTMINDLLSIIVLALSFAKDEIILAINK